MKTIVILCAIAFSTLAVAQPKYKQMQQRIKAHKTSFITNALELTSKEAEKFWPIYNTTEAEIEAIRQNDMRPIKKELKANETITEADADALLKQLLTAEDKMHAAKTNLIKNLKGVIPSVKIIKLKRAEEAFKRRLLKRLNDMRGERDKPKNRPDRGSK